MGRRATKTMNFSPTHFGNSVAAELLSAEIMSKGNKRLAAKLSKKFNQYCFGIEEINRMPGTITRHQVLNMWYKSHLHEFKIMFDEELNNLGINPNLVHNVVAARYHQAIIDGDIISRFNESVF